MKKIFSALSLSIILMSCSQSDPQAVTMADPPLEKEMTNHLTISAKTDSDENMPAPPLSHHKTDTISKKIIKNGKMTIQVGDLKKAQNQTAEILKKSNAYIQQEQFRNTDTDENLSMMIRVPHQNFDKLINSFSDGVGSILSKNISSNDVTEEYTDVSIKLANKKIYLEKYRDLLRNASTTKDILEIQEKIRGLEDEIDVAEGTLRFIDDRVNYSTLELSLYKEKARSSTTSKIGFGSRFSDSLTEGWNSFVGFLLGIVSFWPFLLFIPLVVFLWRKWKARRKK
ncbi:MULTISPECIES: DUF4349 domain-containing protein [Chryseobacterium]|uniref:DUF4349 domain-containing protein n=1 Tax=Chryseobacterium TaxID=59732 RepID=UPI0012979E27|nr:MULTISPECIES: DUF4349 domain-containing protein [Chryseobacterium]MDR6920341.1 ABC-type antimicrobial peptide transport system permease subunit [Chryseobacterium sp. 2987]